MRKITKTFQTLFKMQFSLIVSNYWLTITCYSFLFRKHMYWNRNWNPYETTDRTNWENPKISQTIKMHSCRWITERISVAKVNSPTIQFKVAPTKFVFYTHLNVHILFHSPFLPYDWGVFSCFKEDDNFTQNRLLFTSPPELTTILRPFYYCCYKP